MTVDDQDRFFSKVNVQIGEGCWDWEGATRNGYGRFWLDGRVVSAHRFSYEVLVGPIPDGTVLDHTCRNRSCVNPAHLEPVTHAENLRRSPGLTITQRRATATHCKRGHDYATQGMRIHGGRHRQCRTCSNDKLRERRALKRKEAS